MNQSKMRIKNDLPKGIGMRITMESRHSYYQGKHRYRIRFLVDKKLSKDLIALLEGLHDCEQIQEYYRYDQWTRLWELIYKKELGRKYLQYRCFMILNEHEEPEDVEETFREVVEEFPDVELIAIIVKKVSKVPGEVEKKIINIPEKKLMKILKPTGVK